MRRSFAFRIIDFLYLQGGYKILEIDESVPFSQQLNCPADGNLLKTICILVSERSGNSQKIRYGCCDICGYCGYIDRPNKEWVEKFYFDLWQDSESKLITEEEIQKIRNLFSFEKLKEKESHKNLIDILDKIKIDKNRYVCEIGCGYGEDLKFLENIGFNKVIGVENSKNRSEIAKRAYNIKTLSGAFENKDIQLELKKIAPPKFNFFPPCFGACI